jgi:hypothetical protein
MQIYLSDSLDERGEHRSFQESIRTQFRVDDRLQVRLVGAQDYHKTQ